MSIIVFILMLSLLVTVHELGHMILAKLFNVYVEEFSIGFGPKIWQKKGKETTFSIRAIPLGGYNKMVENEEENLEDKTSEKKDDGVTEKETVAQNSEPKLRIPVERTFYGVSPLKRIAILLAGPVFNFILAILICVGIYEVSPYKAVYPDAKIVEITPDSPAEEAGLMVGDLITVINYEDGTRVEVTDWYDVIVNNQLHMGDGYVVVTVQRNGSILDFHIQPVYNEEQNAYLIGIVSGSITTEKMNPIEAAAEGFKYTFEMFSLTIQSVIMLIGGKMGTESLSGTIGIYNYTKEAMSYGVLTVLSLAANISVSLGVMNLVPVPTFDGGRIVLCIIEKIVGHRLDKRFENAVMMIGLAIMVGLLLLTTYLDVSRLFK